MHWWVFTMVVLYLLSGITVVKSDEVAVILRWGRLVGATTALQQHGPGLLFAFPRPVDRVVRVQVKHVWEVPVNTLAPMIDESEEENQEEELENGAKLTLNPLTQGYALTGDENIVHLAMIARYRVRDPALWAFYGPKSEDVLRVEVTAAMVRSLGEMGVDRVLSDGRETLIATATRRAQQGLDASQSGLELTLLELTGLIPPLAVRQDFEAVQSAYIDAETLKNDAQAYAQSTIPQAHATADASVQTAHGDAAAALAAANGDATAFLALDREYRANQAVVRERLYRDAVEHAISTAGSVRWVPPPFGNAYHGFRISIAPGSAGPASTPSTSATPTNPYPVPPPPPSSGTSKNQNKGPVPSGVGNAEEDRDPD
jgi:membrane protease subunit HflK